MKNEWPPSLIVVQLLKCRDQPHWSIWSYFHRSQMIIYHSYIELLQNFLVFPLIVLSHEWIFMSFGTSCKYRKQQRMLFEKGIKRNNTKYLKKCTMCVNREIIVIFSNSYILNLYIVDIFWSLCGRVTLSTATKLFHLFERFK